MRTLPPRLYIISPSLGVQTTDRCESELALSTAPSLPSSLPLASHPHAEQERYASQPVDGISEQCTTRGPTSGLISEDDPDMFMFTMQERLQIDPRTINSHLQISHLVKETKRAPCSPTEPYTAA